MAGIYHFYSRALSGLTLICKTQTFSWCWTSMKLPAVHSCHPCLKPLPTGIPYFSQEHSPTTLSEPHSQLLRGERRQGWWRKHWAASWTQAGAVGMAAGWGGLDGLTSASWLRSAWVRDLPGSGGPHWTIGCHAKCALLCSHWIP